MKAQDEVLGQQEKHTESRRDGTDSMILKMKESSGQTRAFNTWMPRTNQRARRCRPSGTRVKTHPTQDFVLGFHISCLRHLQLTCTTNCCHQIGDRPNAESQ